jgi:hypothetical protein
MACFPLPELTMDYVRIISVSPSIVNGRLIGAENLPVTSDCTVCSSDSETTMSKCGLRHSYRLNEGLRVEQIVYPSWECATTHSFNSRTNLPVGTLQRRTVPSWCPVAKVPPSGDSATVLASSASKLRRGEPESARHNCTVLLFEDLLHPPTIKKALLAATINPAHEGNGNTFMIRRV